MRVTALPFVAACIGRIAWSAQSADAALLVLMLMPILWGAANSRLHAGAVMLAYIMATGVNAPAALAVFNQWSLYSAWLIWGVYSVIYAGLWTLCWSKNASRRAWGMLMAIVILTLPPFGTTYYGSLLTACGWLFEGWGIWGIAAYILLMMLAAAAPSAGALVMGVVVLMAFSTTTDPRQLTWPDVTPVHTALPRFSDSDVQARYDRTFELLDRAQAALNSPGAAILFPENSLGASEVRTQWLWDEVAHRYSIAGKTLIIGGAHVHPDQTADNTLILMGATRGILRASATVPIGSWHPWQQQGHMQSRWFDTPDTLHITLDGKSVRLGAIFCWEELLPWSWMRYGVLGVDRIAVVSNTWFDASGDVDASQKRSSQAWARLWGMKFTRAVNKASPYRLTTLSQ
ncbi:hypothetical protein B9Z51_06920 [Limnohabitans sp. T6-5]|uniref:hypothetical protein n=1 Tax=Limnohabitans sp. T6-5 TaxID=1100724 RepID=UPI000D3CCBB8|nr:hypothetical protein [Limnohabitans sp. T6-5]PUE08676.1 hypothetical protein B9Z51_06920 [Limnohabitans sp. T6-5]